MSKLTFGGGRASMALGASGGTAVKTQELIEQLKETMNNQLNAQATALLNKLNETVEQQKQENENLKVQNEKLAIALELKNQQLESKLETQSKIQEKERSNLIEKNVKLEVELAEQAQKLGLIQEKEEKVINGINSLLTYTMKTNFEQCDITANLSMLAHGELEQEECIELTVTLQKEAATDALTFFADNREVFQGALQNIELVLSGEDGAGL